jgi:hypothetical protein
MRSIASDVDTASNATDDATDSEGCKCTPRRPL